MSCQYPETQGYLLYKRITDPTGLEPTPLNRLNPTSSEAERRVDEQRSSLAQPIKGTYIETRERGGAQAVHSHAHPNRREGRLGTGYPAPWDWHGGGEGLFSAGTE